MTTKNSMMQLFVVLWDSVEQNWTQNKIWLIYIGTKNWLRIWRQNQHRSAERDEEEFSSLSALIHSHRVRPTEGNFFLADESLRNVLWLSWKWILWQFACNYRRVRKLRTKLLRMIWEALAVAGSCLLVIRKRRWLPVSTLHVNDTANIWWNNHFQTFSGTHPPGALIKVYCRVSTLNRLLHTVPPNSNHKSIEFYA